MLKEKMVRVCQGFVCSLQWLSEKQKQKKKQTLQSASANILVTGNLLSNTMGSDIYVPGSYVTHFYKAPTEHMIKG